MNASPCLQSRFSGWLRDELRPAVLLKSLTAGLLIYILEVVITVSFAALIFSGKLADQLPYGLGFMLAANAVLGSFVALTSSYPGAVAVSQDIPSAILAIASASVVAAVIADEPSVIYLLSREVLEHIEKTDAEAASVFHRLIVHILSERVVRLTRALDTLER